MTIGTGSEDPANFDLIVFDGNRVTPQQLNSNPGLANFFHAGKIVTIVNPTDSDRTDGLHRVFWFHPRIASPALALFGNYDSNGRLQLITGVEYPLTATVGVDVGDPEHPSAASKESRIAIHQPKGDPNPAASGRHWLEIVKARHRRALLQSAKNGESVSLEQASAAVDGTQGNIVPATIVGSQPVLGFDHVVTENVTVLNALWNSTQPAAAPGQLWLPLPPNPPPVFGSCYGTLLSEGYSNPPQLPPPTLWTSRRKDTLYWREGRG